MRWKKKILVAALCMGCVGSAVAMLPTEKAANAAVLVHDDQNILEAAKTAVNTADILTNAQKELALQIIDMASMDKNALEAYLTGQIKKQNEIFDESMGKDGALSPNTSVQAYWEENFQNIEYVLNGQMTPADAYNAQQKALRALEKTEYDALHNAKETQKSSRDLGETITEAVTNSANAAGTKEAVQANTQAVAAAAMGTFYGNALLADMTAQQALKYQKENLDEASAMAMNKMAAKQMADDVAAMKAAIAN